MGIAFDAATDGGLVNPGSSLTFGHTVTGANPILWVGIRSRINVTSAVTSVTYHSAASALVGTVPGVQSGAVARALELYQLTNPDTGGAFNVVISASVSDVLMAVAASYPGAKQSGQPDAFDTAFSATTSVSKLITTVADQCWGMAVFGNDGGAVTPDGATTMRVNSANGIALGDSNTAVSAGAFITLGASQASANNDFTEIIASFAPPVSGHRFFLIPS